MALKIVNCFKCDKPYYKIVDDLSELIEEQQSTADENLCPSCTEDNDWAKENKLDLSFAVNQFKRADGIEFYIKRVKKNNQFVVVNKQDEVLYTAENYFWANDWACRNVNKL